LESGEEGRRRTLLRLISLDILKPGTTGAHPRLRNRAVGPGAGISMSRRKRPGNPANRYQKNMPVRLGRFEMPKTLAKDEATATDTTQNSSPSPSKPATVYLGQLPASCAPFLPGRRRDQLRAH
jgi:hypothetical protein